MNNHMVVKMPSDAALNVVYEAAKTAECEHGPGDRVSACGPCIGIAMDKFAAAEVSHALDHFHPGPQPIEPPLQLGPGKYTAEIRDGLLIIRDAERIVVATRRVK